MGDVIEHAGCRVTLPDSPTAGRQLLTGQLPESVREVLLTRADATRDGLPVVRLEARIATERPRGGALGRDPLGVLLERRLAAGDAWAARIVGGLDQATEAYRRFVPPTPEPAPTVGVRADAVSGLQVAIDHLPGLTTVRAVAPESPEPVPAMLCLVLDVLAELAGPLDGREFALEPEGAVPRPAPPPATPSSERVTLDQVGGLDAIVAQFRQIAVSFRHPDVMARWGARRPQGILMYGPPGTGKTMLARALANEIGAEFREVRTPEILDKWLGASERNIKRIFREARRYRNPTVLLFDEFDSIISYAGQGGDAASQAFNAVAGIFKQEMNDLFEDNPTIIVVATTNFPQRVDDSLIRSGRFDVKLSVPLPDEGGRTEILRKMVGELAARHERDGFRMFAPDLDLAELGRASHGMTGADLREVLRRAQLAKAMHEARTGDPAPPITVADLLAELDALRGVRA
ncbi:ATP-binding protein [Spirilliplanes yamanashiensis]|uniref:AAA+ ATPase domain-containing protein n=1 Tax=Spirilliplanes yamanashiensis TaxID=42233 RepID=A0A8J4DI99_9ACTN|nr:ATP-binding protein [Spirilliplanes yamanashiensis]MDP9817470.1 transitional endoplasmic reticulum ATPase [Spirilliplanes yamanashiensis]GIJ02877.1 hypothetical protein Sya03_22290 [Spirilliplanes yamanashiensis]